jgi:hypothetical protein
MSPAPPFVRRSVLAAGGVLAALVLAQQASSDGTVAGSPTR